jgi:hypothetical protein
MEELLLKVTDFCYRGLIFKCSFGVLNKEKTLYKININKPCHLALTYCQYNIYDTLITSYPAESELDKEFFNFMKNTLYHKFKDHFHLKYYNSKPYIEVTDLDKIPANVLYNFCITSRFIVEFQKELKIWAKYNDTGLHQLVSFMCMGSNVCPVTGKLNRLFNEYINTHHWPFDQNSCPAVIMSGGLVSNFNTSFKSKPTSCTPSNIIWGDQYAAMRCLIGKTPKEINDEFAIHAKA